MYIFFKNLNKNLSLINQKNFIFNNNFIKIDNLLCLIKFFKYVSIIFIYLIKSLKNSNIVKKILSNLHFIIEVNILLKSIFGI